MNAEYIQEPERTLPVRYADYDVIVAGGGIAGIAAALAAARAGKRVLLLERMFALGGLATLGLVTIYLPLCDGKGHQLSFGLAEELLKLSIREGWERDYPDTWLSGSTEHGRQRYKVRYNAQVFAVLAEQLLAEENVKILYGTTVCQVLRSGSRLTHIIVENKDGRFAIPVRSAVDATGDADLFHQAAAPVRLHETGNMPAAWFYETGAEGNVLHMVGTADVPTDEENPAVPDPVVGGRISGVDADEISRRQISCHGQSLAAFLKSGPLTEQHSLATLASIPQLRMTRCIRGAYEMDDTEAHKSFADSIGMAGDWRKCGPAYEIPLRTLYTEDLVNCMAAGRIISVTDAMWDITRVIPACAVTGQAAGLAMAMTDDVTALDVSRLQNELVKYLHIPASEIVNCRTYGGHGEQMAVFASTTKVKGEPLTDFIGTTRLPLTEWEELKVRVIQGGKHIIDLRGRSSFQSPAYLSIEMIAAAMGGQPFRWPAGTYVSDKKFDHILMAMETSITKEGVSYKEVQGTPEEQKEMEESYAHLCKLRDEVIAMGILPEINKWHELNKHIN